MSLPGSVGFPGSVYSPRLPSPLVSTISAVQPCDAFASPVSSNFLTLSQPTTPPPPPLDVHSVLFLSKPNCRWCVVKQVSPKVYFIVFGSSIPIWRWLSESGDSLAEIRSEFLPHQSGSLTA